jgi:hypothetical protein
MRPKKTLALIEISGVDYSSMIFPNESSMIFPNELALDGEAFHVPAAIDSQIGLG